MRAGWLGHPSSFHLLRVGATHALPHPAVPLPRSYFLASRSHSSTWASGADYLRSAQDWWEGPHHEGLTCQNFEKDTGHGPPPAFELVGPRRRHDSSRLSRRPTGGCRCASSPRDHPRRVFIPQHHPRRVDLSSDGTHRGGLGPSVACAHHTQSHARTHNTHKAGPRRRTVCAAPGIIHNGAAPEPHGVGHDRAPAVRR